MASVVGAGIAPVRRIPAASTSGFPAAAMHRPLPAAGVGARSRSPATYVLRRRSATARARGARSGAMTFARARVAPGGFQARFTRDDTGSATSRDLVGMACRAFVLRRERLTRRVATRASSGDGESLERRRSSLPRERNDETPTTSALGRVFGAGDDASSTARDALAAVTVAYAFAAWRLLQWPATTPAASSVPGPLLACAVAAGATAVAAPLLAAAAHPAANYGVRFPLLTRAAFGVEGAALSLSLSAPQAQVRARLAPPRGRGGLVGVGAHVHMVAVKVAKVDVGAMPTACAAGHASEAAARAVKDLPKY